MLLAQLALVNIFRFILKLEDIVFQLNLMQHEDFFFYLHVVAFFKISTLKEVRYLHCSMPHASTKGPK